ATAAQRAQGAPAASFAFESVLDTQAGAPKLIYAATGLRGGVNGGGLPDLGIVPQLPTGHENISGVLNRGGGGFENMRLLLPQLALERDVAAAGLLSTTPELYPGVTLPSLFLIGQIRDYGARLDSDDVAFDNRGVGRNTSTVSNSYWAEVNSPGS